MQTESIIIIIIYFLMVSSIKGELKRSLTKLFN